MKYRKHLRKDAILAPLMKGELHQLEFHKNIPLRLISAIMSQQLNTKVARIIYNRFLELFGGNEPKPAQILEVSFEQLRGIGLSNAKVHYVQNVARFCVEQKVTDKKLLLMSNDDVLNWLIQIKGVGKWTVEMLLMFSLGREDVFPVDDLGIQMAMVKLYGWETLDKKSLKLAMVEQAANWSPYRTYACLHLWKWKDGG